MASLKVIASELEVSYTLVSKVLSGRMGTTGVSAPLREAILSKARDLDYRPNPLAVALKGGRKGAIAVFLHSLGSPGSDLSLSFLTGVSGAIAKTGSRLWLRFFESDEEFLAGCEASLIREVDGLIIGGAEHPGLLSRLVQMDQEKLPIVSIFGSQLGCERPTNIAVDYRSQCRLAAAHLFDQGCRKLAHFRCKDLRYEGFASAHLEAGLPVSEDLVIFTDGFEMQDGRDAVRQLLDEGKEMDGLVAESDQQAIGAIRELQRRGLRVPEDVKVTGVDNSPLAQTCEVPLTSATSEMEACGTAAVKTLVEKIEGVETKPKIIQPRLVVRASTLAK